MRKLFTLFILFAALPAAAQQMLVDYGTETPQIIEFDKFQKITFNGTTVNILFTDGTANSSTMSEISRIKFGDFTSIEEVECSEKELVTYISGDAIAVNCKAGTAVTVYNVIGTQLIRARLESYGGNISIAGLPKGIYIVKAGDRTTKIVKR